MAGPACRRSRRILAGTPPATTKSATGSVTTEPAAITQWLPIVTKDIPPNSVVGGVPAKVLKTR